MTSCCICLSVALHRCTLGPAEVCLLCGCPGCRAHQFVHCNGKQFPPTMALSAVISASPPQAGDLAALEVEPRSTRAVLGRSSGGLLLFDMKLGKPVGTVSRQSGVTGSPAGHPLRWVVRHSDVQSCKDTTHCRPAAGSCNDARRCRHCAAATALLPPCCYLQAFATRPAALSPPLPAGGHGWARRGGAVWAHQPWDPGHGHNRRLHLLAGLAQVSATRCAASSWLLLPKCTHAALARAAPAAQATACRYLRQGCAICDQCRTLRLCTSALPSFPAAATKRRRACRRTPVALLPWTPAVSWWPPAAMSAAWAASLWTRMPRCAR